MPIRMVSQMGMAWRPGRTSRPGADDQADDDGADDAGDGHIGFLSLG
jgi:hypothetical protein